MYRNGRFLKHITRPAHEIDGHLMVTYKGRKHRVLPDDRIELIAVESTMPADAQAVEISHRDPQTDMIHNDKRSDAPTFDDWTPEQLRVITSPLEARLIVEAAPGTGKTAVACARVAHLLNEGVAASNILLLSFTRTAIHEVRNRIGQLAELTDSAHGVRIATIDSHAWQLRQGFDGKRARVFSTFADGIEETITLLAHPDDDLAEELETLQHVVVDEAQDVVGRRCVMIRSLVGLLSTSCGITVLCDSAQAIYGFSEDDTPLADGSSLPEVLAAEEELGFAALELTDVIRTSSPGLRHIFLNTRKMVLHPNQSSMENFLDDLREHSDGHVQMALATNGIAGRDDVLVLYRQRAQVLLSGAFLAQTGARFRIRMSGYPTRIDPWIGKVFWDWTAGAIEESEFKIRAIERLSSLGSDPDAQWQLLVRHAGRSQSVVDMRRLRELLSRQQPPLDFSTPELGDGGPILGTIHASKGREAEEVHLMLRDLEDSEVVDAEEMRVVFVGATRARSVLKLGRSGGSRSSQTTSGRRWRGIPGKLRAQLEIGRSHDVDPIAQVSRHLLTSQAEALESQHAIESLSGVPVPSYLRRVHVGGDNYEWRLFQTGMDAPLAQLDSSFNNELWAITKAMRKHHRSSRVRSVGRINHIYMMCSRTIVRPAGDSALALQYSPWSESGIWLAPALFAFSTVGFTDA